MVLESASTIILGKEAGARVQLVLPAGTDTEIWDVGGIGGAKSLDLELERKSPRLGLPLRQCETQVGR